MSDSIFEKSSTGRASQHLWPEVTENNFVPDNLKRDEAPKLPELAELDVVRHFTNLSKQNFSIDGEFYPLGSCTMKYNPRGVHNLATCDDALARHPLAPSHSSQGYLSCLYELQSDLANITGMTAVSLTPMAGAQGEFAGVAMIKAYHADNGESYRNEMLIPDSAHGTNPASAVMCGYKIKEVKTLASGDLDFDDLRSKITGNVAGLMLTNPSTLGLFEKEIIEITNLIHDAGGLLYYDGANLNAILGHVRPGDMGFDVMHLNLHKTFATPHGGGGPGSGPVACNDKLKQYLPTPIVGRAEDGSYRWLTREDNPKSIGRLSAFMGNAGVLLRAYLYIKILGSDGLRRVSELATLNANYLKEKFKELGLDVSFPDRRATHEFIITFAKLAKEKHITALDLAKRLLDERIHAPTMYFPLTVPECWLIEPTETESLDTLNKFVAVIEKIISEADNDIEKITTAPHKMPVARVDEVTAVKNLDVCYKEKN